MAEPSTALDAIRRQLTIVRALADAIERCLAEPDATERCLPEADATERCLPEADAIERCPPVGVDSIREQLVEELARLGCQCVETGAAMAKRDRW